MQSSSEPSGTRAPRAMPAEWGCSPRTHSCSTHMAIYHTTRNSLRLSSYRTRALEWHQFRSTDSSSLILRRCSLLGWHLKQCGAVFTKGSICYSRAITVSRAMVVSLKRWRSRRVQKCSEGPLMARETRRRGGRPRRLLRPYSPSGAAPTN